MLSVVLEKIISGNWVDIDTNKPTQHNIKKIIIEKGARVRAADILSEAGDFKKILLVADENTIRAAGEEFFKKLKQKYFLEIVILPAHVEPEKTVCDEIILKAKNYDFILAVGSGTINDICKYSAFALKIPYGVLATAPSMNGYASSTASIKNGKFKNSVKAALPTLIICDTELYETAPARLIASGFGDLLCRPACEVDWFLSHKVLGTEFRETPLDIIHEAEKSLLENFALLTARDEKMLGELINALIISGLGMHISGSSNPASQGEHLIAHFLEMKYPEKAKAFLHGELVALATIYSLKLQQRILQERPKIKVKNLTIEFFAEKFGKEEGAMAFAEYQVKFAMFPSLSEKLAASYDAVQRRFDEVSLNIEALREKYKILKLPVEPEAAGFTEAEFMDAAKNACLIRNRFTFLDIDFLRE